MAFVSTCPFDRTLSCPWQAAQLPPLTPALDMSSLASAHNRRPAAKNTSRQNKTGATFFIFTNCSFRVIVYTRYTKETGWPEGKIKTSGRPAIHLNSRPFQQPRFCRQHDRIRYSQPSPLRLSAPRHARRRSPHLPRRVP